MCSSYMEQEVGGVVGFHPARLTCPGVHPPGWHLALDRGRRSHRRGWWGTSRASKLPSTTSGSVRDRLGGEPAGRANPSSGIIQTQKQNFQEYKSEHDLLRKSERNLKYSYHTKCGLLHGTHTHKKQTVIITMQFSEGCETNHISSLTQRQSAINL